MKKKDDFSPPCKECGGRCCKYVALEIDKPTNKNGYDQIRWYLAHKNIAVFVDHEKDWYVEFRTDCEKQSDDGLCTIYQERPRICRDYGTEEGLCEYYDSPYFLYFVTIENFEKYLDDKKIDWKYKNLK